LPEPRVLEKVILRQDGLFDTTHGPYRKCANHVEHGVCNWMVPEGDENELCQACRLNNVIPDLSSEKNRALWAEVEGAKRRLIFTLHELHLPIIPKREDPEHGLAFDIMSSEGGFRVLTGHSEGLITLNLDEADPSKRERMRMKLKERYRTLLGHFRHEIGHYYFETLVNSDEQRRRFREDFGDETVNYQSSLDRHYQEGPPPDWHLTYISAYATMHPWEDWAETFAHYLHIHDTLETARNYGLSPQRGKMLPAVSEEFTVEPARPGWIEEWTELSIALNALNRSMGLPDAYPFALTETVWKKLSFVGEMIHAYGDKPVEMDSDRISPIPHPVSVE